MEKIERYNVSARELRGNSAEDWSRIIQRLASVDVWPEGEEGIKLALQLIGIEKEEIENE
jgi:hypothetical protein